MLRTKLFKAMAALVLVVGVLSAALGIRMIQTRVVAEAQERVWLDLSSERAHFRYRMAEIETILRLAAFKRITIEAVAADEPSGELHTRLEMIRNRFGLDFLSAVDEEGLVVVRTAPPYAVGDFMGGNASVARALGGESGVSMEVLSAVQLEREAEGLAERAYLPLEATPRARPTERQAESRGMVMMAAVPVHDGVRVVGALYGGVLLNRNHALVDGIEEVVYGSKQYGGAPMGTVTLFLDDCRIATTVRLPNGNRALGTRASKEVADQVLDNERPWIGPAFVVSRRYLSAYDAIRNGRGEVIGMLYVGILEQPFRDMGRNLMLRYAALLVFALALALWLAFVLAGVVSGPLQRLIEAANRHRRGERPGPVPEEGGSRETRTLILAFNEMTAALAEREARLAEMNESLAALNRSYMETLGFVSHELKSPIAAMINYMYLLRHGKLGATTEKQDRALRLIDGNIKRIVEMARHYLNLSRIENGEMEPVRSRVDVAAEVLEPLLDSMQEELAARRMKIESRVGPEVALRADLNQVREIFENLLSNAVKYGAEGGRVEIAGRRDGAMAVFEVGNEGPGIPADRIGALFQKFSRLEGQPGVRTQKGTGLGLFITKHIVEAHGGTIGVESRPGEWTVFRFTLPCFDGKQEGT